MAALDQTVKTIIDTRTPVASTHVWRLSGDPESACIAEPTDRPK